MNIVIIDQSVYAERDGLLAFCNLDELDRHDPASSNWTQVDNFALDPITQQEINTARAMLAGAEAIRLLQRLTHPAAADDDLEDAQAFLATIKGSAK